MTQISLTIYHKKASGGCWQAARSVQVDKTVYDPVTKIIVQSGKGYNRPAEPMDPICAAKLLWAGAYIAYLGTPLIFGLAVWKSYSRKLAFLPLASGLTLIVIGWTQLVNNVFYKRDGKTIYRPVPRVSKENLLALRQACRIESTTTQMGVGPTPWLFRSQPTIVL